MERRPIATAVVLLLCVGAAVFFAGITWGLPSRAADPYLFGDRPVWTGEQILKLAGTWDDNPDLGADVALNPLSGRDKVLQVNDTDARRAQIVRRYRLFSYQPDEASTLRALAGMKPGKLQLDPRLYQYGGLWVYPVGAMLRIAAQFHLVDLRGDVTYYLDHPDAFGRFYVVARAYTALWGLVGVVAVFALVRRIVGGVWLPAGAGLCFMAMPVVVNMAHEAKPHLPGAVLMLLAALAGAKFVETGARRAWLAAGILSGAAVGMVLSSVPVAAVLAGMVLLRRMTWKDRVKIFFLSGAVAAATYLVTNPYVPINLLHNREVLRSNLGTSRGFYHAELTTRGVGNALRLMGAGTGFPLALAGLVGAVMLGLRAVRVRGDGSEEEIRRRATGLLLAAPAVWVAGQCVLFATGKPGEFGRFAIVPDVFLMIEAVVAVGTFVRRPALAGIWIVALFVATSIPGGMYLRGFLRDSRPRTGRLQLAEVLWESNRQGANTLCVYAEPAPYCQPPVDLWGWKVLLMPRDSEVPVTNVPGDVGLRTRDVAGGGAWGWVVGAPISWADKPMEVVERRR